MVSLDVRNGNSTKPVCPSQTLLLLSKNIDFRWSNGASCPCVSLARQRRLEADRLARNSGLVTLIGPVLLNSMAAALWLWFGQG